MNAKDPSNERLNEYLYYLQKMRELNDICVNKEWKTVDVASIETIRAHKTNNNPKYLDA